MRPLLSLATLTVLIKKFFSGRQSKQKVVNRVKQRFDFYLLWGVVLKYKLVLEVDHFISGLSYLKAVFISAEVPPIKVETNAESSLVLYLHPYD